MNDITFLRTNVFHSKNQKHNNLHGTMKILSLIFISILISWSGYTQQPLVADAGRDSIFCSSPPDSIQLGGQPAASGGYGNYQYTWDIYPKPYVPFSNAPNLKYYASDFISDTTISKPHLIRTLPSNDKGPLYFILSIIDDSLNSALDSVKFWRVNWVVSMLNSMIITFPGDTQTIIPNGFEGGIPPYTLDWGESASLIGNRYDYNVYPDVYIPSRQVIIPSGPSPKWYGLTITDSLGCSTIVGTYQGFIIQPLGIGGLTPVEQPRIRIRDQTILIDTREPVSGVSLFSINGQLLMSNSPCNGNHCTLHANDSGIFILHVHYESNRIENIKIRIP